MMHAILSSPKKALRREILSSKFYLQQGRHQLKETSFAQRYKQHELDILTSNFKLRCSYQTKFRNTQVAGSLQLCQKETHSTFKRLSPYENFSASNRFYFGSIIAIAALMGLGLNQDLVYFEQLKLKRGIPSVKSMTVVGNEAPLQFQSHLEAPQRHWEDHGVIGTGAFGHVKLGVCTKSGDIAAIKVVNRKGNTSNHLEELYIRREIFTLERIRLLGGHDNIVQLKDVYIDKDNNTCIVMELIEGGELFDHLISHGVFTERNSAIIVKQVADALAFLHKHDIVHKDIKPENILLTRGHSTSYEGNVVKLIDFGSSGSEYDETGTLDIGTSAYWPPEYYFDGRSSKEADLWALGCILYIMLSGAHPFDLDGKGSEDEVATRICQGKYTFEGSHWDQISEPAKHLITQLLNSDPNKRYTSQQVLQHPWIKSISR